MGDVVSCRVDAIFTLAVQSKASHDFTSTPPPWLIVVLPADAIVKSSGERMPRLPQNTRLCNLQYQMHEKTAHILAHPLHARVADYLKNGTHGLRMRSTALALTAVQIHGHARKGDGQQPLRAQLHYRTPRIGRQCSSNYHPSWPILTRFHLHQKHAATMGTYLTLYGM